jgi:ferredoxin
VSEIAGSVGRTESLRVAVDHELCNGVGLCAEAAPAVFELRDDGKSWVRELRSADIDDERLAEAHDPLPVVAITGEWS